MTTESTTEFMICVRYWWHDTEVADPGEPEIYYLGADEVGTNSKGQPKREWNTFADDVAMAFDFLEEYGTVEKAIPMAHRLGKIVEVGKKWIAEGFDMEVVVVTVRTTYEVTEISNNPMTVIAAAAL